MPGLFALGQHLALEAAQAQLLPEEALFAHLDDFYVVCAPQRARQVFDLVRLALREHAHIEVNLGTTRMWNAAGEEPANCAELDTDEAHAGHVIGRCLQKARASLC